MSGLALRPILIALLAPSLLLACSSDDDRQVNGIPPGTARGTATSGTYQARYEVVSCAGNCQSPLALCRVGDVGTGQQRTVQRDGTLSVEFAGGLLAGGIDSDGSFAVGGHALVQGLDSAVRWDGLATATAMTGAMQIHASGTYRDQAVDCASVAEVTAMRQ